MWGAQVGHPSGVSNPFCRRGQRARPGDRGDAEAGAALRCYAAATSALVEAGDLDLGDTIELGVCGLGPVRVSVLLAIDAHTTNATRTSNAGATDLGSQ